MMPKKELNKKKLAEVSAGFKANTGMSSLRKLVGTKPKIAKPKGQSITGSRLKRSK